MAMTEVEIDDVSLSHPEDSIVVRLPNEDVLEVYGDGTIMVYINKGGNFSHKFHYIPVQNQGSVIKILEKE